MRVQPTPDGGATAELTPAEVAELRVALPKLASRAANALAAELGKPAPGTVRITRFLTNCSRPGGIAADAVLSPNTDPLAATLLLRAGFADEQRQGRPTGHRFHILATDGADYAADATREAVAMLTACNIANVVVTSLFCGHPKA